MPHPLAAMFFDKFRLLEKSWKTVTKEIFLPSYIEIGPVASDKKLFKVFLYRENKPHLLEAMFFDES